jgi:hypothetical protein
MLGDTDVSGKTTSVALNESTASVDVTAMGSGAAQNAPGLDSWTAALEFVADVDTMGSIRDLRGTSFTVEIRPTSGDVGPTNPGYTGNAIITEFTEISGAVGDKSACAVSLVGNGPLTRSVTAV